LRRTRKAEQRSAVGAAGADRLREAPPATRPQPCSLSRSQGNVNNRTGPKDDLRGATRVSCDAGGAQRNGPLK
jgi:hypothetical protein